MPQISRIETLNQLSDSEKKSAFQKCCGSVNWVEKMLEGCPYSSETSLLSHADASWKSLRKEDWIEAFAAHPKIGERKGAGKWESKEQSGVANASEKTLRELETYNEQYFDRFGHIFLVCATGKSAEEMLDILKSRLEMNASEELHVAAEEQNKITALRIEKLLQELGD